MDCFSAIFDTSEHGKQIIPYLYISSTDFITILQIPPYNKYVRLYLKFKKNAECCVV